MFGSHQKYPFFLRIVSLILCIVMLLPFTYSAAEAYEENTEQAEALAVDEENDDGAEKPIAKVTSIAFDESNLTLAPGSTHTLSLIFQPENASNKSVRWESSAPESVSVENGLLSAIAPGHATISAIAEDGGSTAKCEVVVENATSDEVRIAVTKVSLNKTDLVLTAGGTGEQLEALFEPRDADNQQVTWTSDDSSIATIENGLVVPVSEGSTVVSAITEDGSFSASCVVTVSSTGINKIILDKHEISIILGEGKQELVASIDPESASEVELVWTSSDPDVATVENGTVTAVAEGECDITVSTVDEKYKDTCHVRIVKPVCNLEGIDFGPVPKYENVEYTFSAAKKTYVLHFTDNKAYAFRIRMGEISTETPLFVEISDGSKVKKATLKAGNNQFLAIAPAALPTVGNKKTLTISIGTKNSVNGSFKYVCETYTYELHRIPGLKDLSVKDSESNTLEISPKFDAESQSYRYSVTTANNESTLKISANPVATTTTIYIDGKEIGNSLNEYEIDLTMLTADENNVVTIPIELKNSSESNTYYLSVGLPAFLPTITKQPENTTVEKGEKKALSVSVDAPEIGTISYEWYERNYGIGNYALVQGATEATYTPPDTNSASKRLYKCRVINTVGINRYTVDTDEVLYTVNLTYVNKPVVLKEPGTFQVTKGIGYDETPTKSEYYVGEKMEPIYIGLSRPELGTEYSCKWYYNLEDSNNVNTAVLLDSTAVAESWYATGELYYNGFSIANSFAEGTYYVFCVTSAKDSTNPDNSNSVISGTFRIVYKPVNLDILKGNGTEEDPFQISTIEELQYLQAWVNVDGRTFEGVNFKFMNDISLPKDWTPIGCTKDGGVNLQAGRNLNAFSGTLDGGGHTLTVAKGGLPLFGYVRGTKVKNLNIFGEEIAGYGLVNHFTGVGMSAETAVLIENVRLLSGSKTLKAGLIGVEFGMNAYAGCSIGYNAIIRNCTIENGVIIGYNRNEDQIGSIAGRFQGSIENCVSYATVYGKNYVGGLVGTLDNAMGLCSISDSQFHGEVSATGNFVGGIIGGGYDRNDSAPNGTRPDILKCSVDGAISGNECVGGILGGDWYVVQTWANVSSSISANTFTGKVSGTKYVGGIVGYFNSLNKFDVVSANTFSSDCGAERAIGFIHYLDTNYSNPTLLEGMVLINTENGTEGLPEIIVTSSPPVYKMTWKAGHNRTDDPLKVEKETEKENICYQLTATGSYKKQYTEGEDLDLTGIVLTAYWTDGSTTTVQLKDVAVSGYNKNEPGQQSVTLSYGSAVLNIDVVVLPKATKITVSVSIMGDSKHGDTATPHGLKMGGLTTWANETDIEADTSETVWDVLQRIFVKHNISFSASSNNQYNTVYIAAVNGLGELDNGKFSGWMYTVNGTHPQVGVAEKYLKQGDVIILHYTDDYTKEEGGMAPAQDTGSAQKVIDLINKIGTVTYTDACKQRIDAARSAYDALTATEQKKVSNYSTLTKAEAEYKRLMQAGATDVDNLIRKIGTVTANSGAAISAAWNGYNALTAEQKALVKNFNTLQEATQKWNQLKTDEVVKLIDKIEEPVTEKSKASIDAARKAYDGLTDAQKRLVTNTKKLTDAEKAYAQLTATPEDKEKAQKVIDLIKKLTNVTLDSEKDIQAARKAYDALTDLQKLLVDNYEVLTTAETKLAMLKAMGKVSDPYINTGDYMEKLGTPGIGVIGGEWMVIGLARSGRDVPGVEDYYKKALEYVESSIDPETGRLHKAKSTDNSRMILALTAIGKDVTNIGGHNLLQGLSDFEYVKYQGNNGPIWALLALDSGNYPAPTGGTTTRQALIDELLRVQTSDGGWAITGDKADSDMTGMALTALAPYYKKDLRVQQAIDKAVARLSEMQDADGGFSTSYGDGKMVATSESISQVVTALSALGINPDTDERFIKNGSSAIDALLRYYVNGGGFKHVMDGEVDGMGTEQAYYALTAYYRFLSDKTSLYDMSDIIDMGGDPVEITAEPTVPATTEPAEVEQTKASYPWWIPVICIFVGCGCGVVIMLIIPKFKKKKD